MEVVLLDMALRCVIAWNSYATHWTRNTLEASAHSRSQKFLNCKFERNEHAVAKDGYLS